VHSYPLYAKTDDSSKFLAAHPSSFGCDTSDTLVGFNKDPKRYLNLQGIEEEQVDALEHEVGYSKIRRTAQPFRNECHPPCIELMRSMPKPANTSARRDY